MERYMNDPSARRDSADYSTLVDSFGGKYRYVRKLGEGGMGVVLLVEHTGLHRFYAMKCVWEKHVDPGDVQIGSAGNPDDVQIGSAGDADFFSGEDTQRRRLLANEAERMKTLRDPRIPYLIDYLESDMGAALVMEYVDGETLSAYLKKHAPLSEKEALEIMKKVSGIIAYLHRQRQRIIYRDIKPENFIRTPEGGICLLDFGTSLAENMGIGGETVVRSREYKVRSKDYDFEQFRSNSWHEVNICPVTATYGYAAPEQLKGKTAGTEADVYALGALYTYLLTGQDPARPPYRPADPELYAAKIGTPTRMLIRRCLMKAPQDRYPDAAVLEDALEKLWPGHGRTAEKLTDIAYIITLILNIMVWLGVIYARERSFNDTAYEMAAIVLLAVTFLWALYREFTQQETRFLIAKDWNLLYTEKQVPGL